MVISSGQQLLRLSLSNLSLSSFQVIIYLNNNILQNKVETDHRLYFFFKKETFVTENTVNQY